MDIWEVQSRFKIQDGSNVRRVLLKIKKGVQLMAVKYTRTSDPFLLVRGSDKHWYRTAGLEKTLNPVWDENIELDVTNLVIDVQVLDANQFSAPTPMGDLCIRLADFRPPFPEFGVTTKHSFSLSNASSGSIEVELQPLNFGTVYEALPHDAKEALAKFEDKELEKLYIKFQMTAGSKKMFQNGAELVNFCKTLGVFADLVYNAPCSLAFGLGSVGSSVFGDKGEFTPPRSLLITKLTEHPEIVRSVGDQLMRAYDRTRNGRIDFSNAIKGIAAMLHGTPKERAKADLKGDDILDMEEVEAMVTGHIEVFTIALAFLVKYSTLALKTVGLAKDWDSEKMNQMIDIIQAVPQQWKFDKYKTQVCELIFEHLDEDMDGHISKKQYVHWFVSQEAREKYNAELGLRMKPVIGQLQTKATKKLERVVKHTDVFED